ncbi:MAG: hypothetical protein A2826_00755 [Candidatus Doudnabacteria bacterium RIFCSPHIGHO2_01_FULL_43_23]|uniref:Uncharacterized protein n=1 Tax=Candidatus Doudnabacteria bacterium RIFCSPHIGHO2_01_FULL_43_23 TaxID=1817822 RepID=A0A1F5NTM0_9BACT|nr:MAG: hypothetical protein A2826_00755 [Candidatus Doudnabacteria bacterium RIFCSPHIGHO2_01_FULL_43_23]
MEPKLKKLPRYHKFVLVFILTSFFALPFLNISIFTSIPKAQAQRLPNIPLSVPNEEPNFGRECGDEIDLKDIDAVLDWFNGKGGECVPIKVDADPYRFQREHAKAFRTFWLIRLSKTIQTLVAKAIDSTFKIQDYLGYVGLVSDYIYFNRFLFEKLNIPEDRLLTSITFYKQYSGNGPNFRDAVEGSTFGSFLRNKSIQTAGFNPDAVDPADPEYYLKIAQAGSYLSSPYDWYHNYQDKAFMGRSEAKSAATLEVSNSEGYKNSRSKSDLDAFLKTKDLGYFKVGKQTIPIMTPGGYAAKAIEGTLNNILGLKQPFNETNVTAAFVEGIINGIINGDIFRNGAFVPGDVYRTPPIKKETKELAEPKVDEGAP